MSFKSNYCTNLIFRGIDNVAFFYNTHNKKNTLNIEISTSNSENLGELYLKNIKNYKHDIILITSFNSAVTERLEINVNNSLSEIQLENLIAFELQKLVPVNTSKLNIIYYYYKNSENSKIVINLHCCLKDEWQKFTEYCQNNSLKFDYIFFTDNQQKFTNNEEQIKTVLQQNIHENCKNNLSAVLPDDLIIKRHKNAKQLCFSLLFLVLIINGYQFFTSWHKQHQQYNKHVELYNDLNNKLKKVINFNKKQQKEFKKVSQIIKHKTGVSRVEFILNHLYNKIPHDCAISKFQINGNRLKLTIISSQNIMQLAKKLNLSSIITNDSGVDTKLTNDGKNQYSLDLDINEFLFTRN